MSFLKDAPLRQKLTWLAMGCSWVALIVMGLAMGTYEWMIFRRTTFAQLQTLSVVTARNSSAALAFDNDEDAERILSSLQSEPSIKAAALYDAGGAVVAQYLRKGQTVVFPDQAPPDGLHTVHGEFEVVIPVAESKRFGTLLVLADAHLVREHLGAYFLVLLVTTVVSGLIAYLLAGRLRQRITQPVGALVAAAIAVRTDSDYRVRVGKFSEDELGALTDAFNEMLQRVEENQSRLHRSEERLRLALESAKIGTWAWEGVDRVNWDARNYEIFGVPADQAIDATVFWELIEAEDRENLRQAVEQARAKAGDFAGEFRVTVQGSVRMLVIRGVFVADEKGQVQRAVGITMDVTERRRAEARVAESEQRFRIVAERTPALIWSCDASLKRDYFNRTWLSFTGRTLDQESGHGWRESLPKEDLEAWLKLATAAAQQSDPYSLEYRLRRADGAMRWVMETASPRLSADGSFAGFLGTCTDITTRKENEAELELHVRLRTRELEISNRELESFSYSVSHDLRSPVRVIRGFAEVALEEVQSGEFGALADPLERILRATARMDDLISAFIALARISRTEIRLQNVDLSRMAEDIDNGLRSTHAQRKVETKIAAGLFCTGDESLLRIALENLFANAWKFTANREVAHIEFGSVSTLGDTVFFVRDDGAGFNSAFTDKLFQVFQRLHTPSQFEGLGVGLSTVQRVIQRHGGRVWGEGKEGEGAIFYFTIGQLTAEKNEKMLDSSGRKMI